MFIHCGIGCLDNFLGLVARATILLLYDLGTWKNYGIYGNEPGKLKMLKVIKIVINSMAMGVY